MLKISRMLCILPLLMVAAVPLSAQEASFAPGVQKVSLTKGDAALQALRGKNPQARRSVPGVQVAPACITPAGNCWVPGFGPCYCCFGPYGCYNGWSG